MADVSTPATARKPEDFTDTNRFDFKDGINLFGNEIIDSVKTGTNHLLPIRTFDGTVYSVFPDGSIFNGDTVEDSDSNIYTVIIRESSFMPALQRCKIEIDGTTAYVNKDLPSLHFKGYWLENFGSTGSGDGEFQSLVKMAASNRYLYVGDAARDDVQIFTPKGGFVDSFGSNGTGDGEFESISAIAVNEDNLFVGDGSRDDVQIFDLDGTFVDSFGSTGTGDGQFQNISGIAVNENNIFVGDIDRDDIQIFDLDGVFVDSFGSSGTGDGQFQNISCMSIYESRLYVVDSGRGDVQIFDLDGVYISTFSSIGSGEGQLSAPRGIATKGGTCKILDSGRQRLIFFDLQGVFIEEFVNREVGGDGSLDSGTIDIADNDEYLYIPRNNVVNNVVQIFK